eukprot:2415595-Prymnesium_polylepis.1
MYTTPSRSAGMFIRSAAAYLLGKRNESHTTVFSPRRTAPNTACRKPRLRLTGRVSLSTRSCAAGELPYAVFATQTVYYHPQSAYYVVQAIQTISCRCPPATRTTSNLIFQDYS